MITWKPQDTNTESLKSYPIFGFVILAGITYHFENQQFKIRQVDTGHVGIWYLGSGALRRSILTVYVYMWDS